MKQNFPHLFQPLRINKLEIPNRIIMGSMHTGLEGSKEGLRKLQLFYQKRAAGGVGLIVTGGFSPNRRGWLVPFSGKLSTQGEVRQHRELTDVVHANGAKILLQILHAGRYSYHPFAVAPSAIKSPISKFKPWALSTRGILATIQDFADCAELAQLAGYDGVEIMGSEGYLINQFISRQANLRTDDWGGSFANRARFPSEIVKAVRRAVGRDFLLMFRLSLLDLVEKGSTFSETIQLAQLLEQEGVSIFNSGIGWHEARIPTIATSVPRAAFAQATALLKRQVKVPVVAVNRINTPEVAEQILASGEADLISMARPMLADPEFSIKARTGRADEINTCIACNQGCLDLIFQNKRATCLVNPLACYETEYEIKKAQKSKKIAIVGAGPAGISCALSCQERGHQVVVFDQSSTLGGQFNLAKKIPGKAEFEETLRYFSRQLELRKIPVHLKRNIQAQDLLSENYDEIVIATGTQPRKVQIPTEFAKAGAEGPELISYVDILHGRVPAKSKIAIIGAGGIGFDVAKYLLHTSGAEDQKDEYNDSSKFFAYWGIDPALQSPGGLKKVERPKPPRQIILMQRKAGRLGSGLGKTTGWIHRLELANAGVEMLSEVQYQKIDSQGLHITVKGTARILAVDQVVVCAGQESQLELYQALTRPESGFPAAQVHRIGGAMKAGELDAKRAILEGLQLALRL